MLQLRARAKRLFTNPDTTRTRDQSPSRQLSQILKKSLATQCEPRGTVDRVKLPSKINGIRVRVPKFTSPLLLPISVKGKTSYSIQGSPRAAVSPISPSGQRTDQVSHQLAKQASNLLRENNKSEKSSPKRLVSRGSRLNCFS